jgi:hypothetical protein
MVDSWLVTKRTSACGPRPSNMARTRLLWMTDPMQVFTFFCVEADGSVPRFDVAPFADDNAARRRAFELIDLHRGCDMIEVWRGATRLFDVAAPRLVAA